MGTQSQGFGRSDAELDALIRGVKSAPLASAGLVIKTAGSEIVKNGTRTMIMFGGVLRNLAANTDMPALVGTVEEDKFNVFAFFMNSAGTLRTAMGTQGDTLAEVVLPEAEANEALIGFVVINPTGTGDFVGGTTDLDDATVVPNAFYVNSVSPIVPELFNI